MTLMTLPRGLYVITDSQLIPKNKFVTTVEQAILGGAKVVQYRDKSHSRTLRYQQAHALHELCQHYQVPLIINDDAELAAQVNAEGVHLGKNDLKPDAIAQLIEEQFWVGVSCYNQVTLAQQAVMQGASYVAFGSFFASPTKPNATPVPLDILQQVRQSIRCPIVAIGGIMPENGKLLVDLGADNLAIISGVFGCSDVKAAAASYARLFE